MQLQTSGVEYELVAAQPEELDMCKTATLAVTSTSTPAQ